MLFNPPHPFAGYEIGRVKQIDAGHLVFRVDANVVFSVTEYGTDKPEFRLDRYEFPSRYHYVGIVSSRQLPAEQIEKFERMLVKYFDRSFGPQN